MGCQHNGCGSCLVVVVSRGKYQCSKYRPMYWVMNTILKIQYLPLFVLRSEGKYINLMKLEAVQLYMLHVPHVSHGRAQTLTLITSPDLQCHSSILYFRFVLPWIWMSTTSWRFNIFKDQQRKIINRSSAFHRMTMIFLNFI